MALGAVFTKFQPATGILKGDVNSYVTTAAASSDVIGLWSGTCNSSTLLGGGGACVAAPTSGSFTITWDNACTTSPTTLIAWRQVNNIVFWTVNLMSAATCTSDSTSFATTTAIVPAAIRPARQFFAPFIYPTQGGVTATPGCLVINTNGTVQATTAGVGCPNTGVTGWNAGGVQNGVNGLNPSTISYTLD
jgi:hypothetical protein